MANRKLRLLLLEDDDSDRELVLLELRKAQREFQVSTASDRESFRRALERQLPDVVLAGPDARTMPLLIGS